MLRTALALTTLLTLAACTEAPHSDLLAPDDVAFAAAPWSANGSGQIGFDIKTETRFGFHARGENGPAGATGRFRVRSTRLIEASMAGPITCMYVQGNVGRFGGEQVDKFGRVISYVIFEATDNGPGNTSDTISDFMTKDADGNDLTGEDRDSWCSEAGDGTYASHRMRGHISFRSHLPPRAEIP